jgi:glycosyltransferase involved in cell wall biosynthesis
LLYLLFRWVVSNSKCSNKCIFVYNTISYFALPALIVARIFRCKLIYYVADLPIIDHKTSVLQMIEDRIELSLIDKCDLLVTISKWIASDYGGRQPNFLLEAGISTLDIVENVDLQYTNNGTTKCVYSGALNELSGIEMAIDAIELMKNENIQLHIFGRGIMEKYVIEASQRNKNIIYHGYKNNEHVVEFQRKADILINPRIPDKYTTKYTFPSKLLEYMATGVPVITNHLDGIPDEYYKYVTSICEPTPQKWAEMFITISGMEYVKYKYKAESALNYIRRNKAWHIIAERLYICIKCSLFNAEDTYA